MFKRTPKPLHYDENYFLKSYESLDGFLDREKRALSYVDPKSSDVVLDVGCGRGTLVKEFGEICSETIGIDASAAAIRISKKNLRGFSHSHIIRGDATYLPFRNDTFTKITVLEVLEHLDRRDTSRCIDEVHRVLKRNGQVCISTPHIEFPVSFLSKIYRMVTASRSSSLHVDEKNYRIMRKLLTKKGFLAIIQLETYMPNHLRIKGKNALEKIIMKLKYPSPYLSTQMWIFVTKIREDDVVVSTTAQEDKLKTF